MRETSLVRRELHAPKHVMVDTRVLSVPWVPGILLEWRRVGDGPWQGLVTYASTRRSQFSEREWSVRMEWVEAARIREL